MSIAERAKLDLTRRGRVLGTAGDHSDGRTMYVIELDQGGKTQGPSEWDMPRGHRVVLRRYQVTPPLGSGIRSPIAWVSVDPEDKPPTLPPENLGEPVRT